MCHTTWSNQVILPESYSPLSFQQDGTSPSRRFRPFTLSLFVRFGTGKTLTVGRSVASRGMEEEAGSQGTQGLSGEAEGLPTIRDIQIFVVRSAFLKDFSGIKQSAHLGPILLLYA